MNPESLIKLRHHLHAHPELSGMEENTSDSIRRFFEKLNPDKITAIAGTGLLIKFSGKKSGKKILLRAELDALPIREINTMDYRSIKDDISHKCGHDGHMAMLCGIGQWCSENQLNNTDVYLLFQPSEENGQGAGKVVEDKAFDLKPDFCFAIHNIPGFKKNLILVKDDHFSSTVISLIVELSGRTSHAGEPEKGLNPALAIAELIILFEKFNNNDPDKENFFISTPIFIEMGNEAFGTSAGSARLGFTLRCWDNDLMQQRKKEAIDKIKVISGYYHLKLQYEWTEEFYGNNNDSRAVNIVRRAAEMSGLNTYELDKPFKWGEDFGYFTSRYSGAMIGLGAGEEWPALHNPDYDFPDEILETGINLYRGILRTIDNNAS